MPEGSQPSDILSKFDMYFGNVLPLDVLRDQFFSSHQEANEDMVSWSCRLHKMLDLICQKQSMSQVEYMSVLRSKFWNGLASKEIQQSTRHRYDYDETFEEIFAACRTLETSKNQIPKADTSSSRHSGKTVASHQVSSVSTGQTDISNMNKLFHRLDAMENKFSSKLNGIESRLSKVERLQSSAPARSASGSSAAASGGRTSDPPFCSRCKRNTHSVDQCHAKKDKYGRPLLN